MAFLGVFALINFSDAFLILRASELGLGFVSIVLVYAVYNAVYALLSYPAGALSDRVPRSLVFAAGLAVFSVAYVGLGLAPSSGWVWAILPLYGAYTALTDGVARAWVADLLPRAQPGDGHRDLPGHDRCGALVAGVWAGLAWGLGPDPASGGRAVAGLLAVVLALRPPSARPRRRSSAYPLSMSRGAGSPWAPARRWPSTPASSSP